jgi:hypothetical protein
MAQSKAVTVDYPEWSNGTQSFALDYQRAVAAAAKAGDKKGRDEMDTIWLDIFERQLRAKGPGRLKTYLESRPPWQRTGIRPVFKIGGGPALAFSADVFPDGSVELIGLGICYNYPSQSEVLWWTSTIEPRAKAL